MLKKILEHFTKDNCKKKKKKKNQENFTVEKIIEKNSCNLCVKWKVYDNSF